MLETTTFFLDYIIPFLSSIIPKYFQGSARAHTTKLLLRDKGWEEISRTFSCGLLQPALHLIVSTTKVRGREIAERYIAFFYLFLLLMEEVE